MTNTSFQMQDGPLTTTAEARHILEEILSRPFVRRGLGWLSAVRPGRPTWFELICANYDRQDAGRWERLKWAIPSWLVSAGLKRARLDKEMMKKKLFHHRPTVRALSLTARSISKYGLTAPQRFAAPLFLVWNITRACNLRCQHCYENATPKPEPGELTLEQKLRVVDDLADEGVPFLAIAGGEPLVCPDLWAVLHRASERGIHLTVATNGTMLTPRNMERLMRAGVKYVEVSIDSLDPKEHDEFRGHPGAWKKSIEGIKNSVAAGMRTGLAMCFTRKTVDRADEAVQMAIDLGCQTFSHFNFIPVGRGREVMDYDLTPAQREKLLQVLFRRLQEGKINVISTAPQFARTCVMHGTAESLYATGHAGSGQGTKTMVLSRYVGGCGAGRCYCSIQPNGDVTPCVYIPGVTIGNLKTQRFGEIWDCDLFATLSSREGQGGHCGVCGYQAYCGGCRARALAYTGDIRNGDPGCGFNERLWREIEREKEKADLVQIGASFAAAARQRAGEAVL